MGTIQKLIDLFLHLDTYLSQAAVQFGPGIYALLFAVLFMETGVVVTPLLPGDSLLVAAGVLAGAHTLNVWILWIACFCAAERIGWISRWNSVPRIQAPSRRRSSTRPRVESK